MTTALHDGALKVAGTSVEVMLRED